MFKVNKKRGVVVGLIAVLVLAAGAYAYWTAGGDGTGTAAAEGGQQQALTVRQTTTLQAMYPGDSA